MMTPDEQMLLMQTDGEDNCRLDSELNERGDAPPLRDILARRGFQAFWEIFALLWRKWSHKIWQQIARKTLT
ncbi:MAG: hypothetical protein ACLTX6_09925 [Lachnospiraceae bacterium]